MKKYIFLGIAIVMLVLSIYIIYSLSLKTPKNMVQPEDPNILLITIDTLRADHLSSYGYERQTTPNIDAIAKQGIRFTNAYATSPWTAPSIASIMTSLYPINHGVQHGFIQDYKAYRQEILNDKFDTLAELLKAKGYNTFAAVANVHMTEELGFSQGFDYYYCKGFETAPQINEVVFSWKDSIRESEKYFLTILTQKDHPGSMSMLLNRIQRVSCCQQALSVNYTNLFRLLNITRILLNIS
jgi:hypothetical protein